jgi:hypothetical protein
MFDRLSKKRLERVWFPEELLGLLTFCEALTGWLSFVCLVELVLFPDEEEVLAGLLTFVCLVELVLFPDKEDALYGRFTNTCFVELVSFLDEELEG